MVHIRQFSEVPMPSAAPYLDHLEHVPVSHHQGLLNQVDDAIFDGDVGLDDLGEHRAGLQHDVPQQDRTLSLVWGSDGTGRRRLTVSVQGILRRGELKSGRPFCWTLSHLRQNNQVF